MPRYMGQNIVEKLGDLAGLAPEDREVVAYGLEYLLSSAIGVALTLLAGLILGLLREALAVLICWGIMRLFAGGAHCTALWRCTAVSFAGMLAALLTYKCIFPAIPAVMWVAAAATWALLATWAWAPNNSARPVQDPQKRKKLRRRALALVLGAVVLLFYLALGGAEHFQAPAAAGATGLAAGALMLSPAGFKLMAWCDKKMELVHHTLKQRR